MALLFYRQTCSQVELLSAERERAKVRAGSYHTRPENQANDFEKVYFIGNVHWNKTVAVPDKRVNGFSVRETP